MNVHSYFGSNGKDLIIDYIEGLSLDEQVDAYDVLKQLEEGKFDVLAIKRWKGKIKEIYFYKHNRIFYVIVDGENIYLLHACRKQKNKTEKRDSKIIESRAKELSREFDRDFL